VTPLAVTPLAASPLWVAPTLTDALALTIPVPLPVERSGPQLVPVDVMTATGKITDTQSISATMTPTADVLSLLIPTPTPTATSSIVEALDKPVVTGGLAGIAATATAAAPAIEQAAELPPVTEATATEATETETTGTEAGAIGATVPQPVPTLASQPTPDGDLRTAQVPILMYHYLSVPPPGADIYRQDLSVSPDLFASHLDAIQQAGYTAISLYVLLDHLTHGAPLPEKPVVLTFDDGYRDNYTNAFPILRERGITATFFIVTDFINDERPEYLTWEMVREMYAGGMSIEGHGRNHVSLANKDSDYLIWQALGTYETIAAEIGVRPRFISYPAGEYDQRTIDIFSSASYWAGFTTKQGATHRSDDLFQLRRIRVRGTTSPEELLRLLALDW
jgi:peptidoglycan/xylan/chitin deacetylase (PgdA/CDA1 family)